MLSRTFFISRYDEFTGEKKYEVSARKIPLSSLIFSASKHSANTFDIGRVFILYFIFTFSSAENVRLRPA